MLPISSLVYKKVILNLLYILLQYEAVIMAQDSKSTQIFIEKKRVFCNASSIW